jgi:hypothetical protein
MKRELLLGLLDGRDVPRHQDERAAGTRGLKRVDGQAAVDSQAVGSDQHVLAIGAALTVQEAPETLLALRRFAVDEVFERSAEQRILGNTE